MLSLQLNSFWACVFYFGLLFVGSNTVQLSVSWYRYVRFIYNSTTFYSYFFHFYVGAAWLAEPMQICNITGNTYHESCFKFPVHRELVIVILDTVPLRSSYKILVKLTPLPDFSLPGLPPPDARRYLIMFHHNKKTTLRLGFFFFFAIVALTMFVYVRSSQYSGYTLTFLAFFANSNQST